MSDAAGLWRSRPPSPPASADSHVSCSQVRPRSPTSPSRRPTPPRFPSSGGPRTATSTRTTCRSTVSLKPRTPPPATPGTIRWSPSFPAEKGGFGFLSSELTSGLSAGGRRAGGSAEGSRGVGRLRVHRAASRKPLPSTGGELEPGHEQRLVYARQNRSVDTRRCLPSPRRATDAIK